MVNITNSRIKSMVTEWKAKHKQKKEPSSTWQYSNTVAYIAFQKTIINKLHSWPAKRKAFLCFKLWIMCTAHGAPFHTSFSAHQFWKAKLTQFKRQQYLFNVTKFMQYYWDQFKLVMYKVSSSLLNIFFY